MTHCQFLGDDFSCSHFSGISNATILVNPNVACTTCKTQWQGNLPPASMDWLAIVPPEPAHRPECFHRSSQPIDRTDHGEPCNCPNRWLYRCEHPDLSAYAPTTTLKQCRDCPFHEDVYPDED